MGRVGGKVVSSKTQHGVNKNKSHQTNLISFYVKVTKLTHQRHAIDIAYLSKSSDKISHYVLGDMSEKNKQNATLIKNKNRKTGTGEQVVIAWNQFFSDVPESFIFDLTLFQVLNTNFIQNYRTHGHQLCKWHK